MLSSFRNLPPRTRIAVGVGFLTWGAIGLYVTDSAEKKFGLEPTEKDREALPKFTIVEKDA